MTIAGSRYLEKGLPVTVLIQWRQQRKTERLGLPHLDLSTTTPRNVRVQRADGSTVVRPFRGLRRPKEAS